MKEEYDKEKYRRQMQNNRLIGYILSVSGIALAVIIYILAQAFSR